MTDADPDPIGSNTLEVAPGLFLPRSILRFSYTCSGGPGGQNVNKVATRARLRVSVDALGGQLSQAARNRLIKLAGRRVTDAGDLIITAAASRSQRANRQSCLNRLRRLLIDAKRSPRPRKRTGPTAASKQRRIEQKKQRGQIKRRRQRPDSDD